jgi:holin-like protein
MKYISQVLIILLFTFLGEVLSYVIPFPIPAAIYGIVLMLIALGTGILKPEKVRDVSQFLISIMPVLFVSPAVRILEYWGIIATNVAAIATIAVVSTFLVFAVSALVVNALMKKKNKEDKTNG